MRPIAEESEKTVKARQKLLERLGEQESTQADLERARESIHQQIANNLKERLPVEGKFGLFDENQNPAKVSKKVSEKVKELLA